MMFCLSYRSDVVRLTDFTSVASTFTFEQTTNETSSEATNSWHKDETLKASGNVAKETPDY